MVNETNKRTRLCVRLPLCVLNEVCRRLRIRLVVNVSLLMWTGFH